MSRVAPETSPLDRDEEAPPTTAASHHSSHRVALPGRPPAPPAAAEETGSVVVTRPALDDVDLEHSLTSAGMTRQLESGSRPDMLVLFVKTTDDRTHRVSLARDALSLRGLRVCVEAATGIPAHSQRLIASGRLITTDAIVSSLPANSYVHVVPSLSSATSAFQEDASSGADASVFVEPDGEIRRLLNGLRCLAWLTLVYFAILLWATVMLLVIGPDEKDKDKMDYPGVIQDLFIAVLGLAVGRNGLRVTTPEDAIQARPVMELGLKRHAYGVAVLSGWFFVRISIESMSAVKEEDLFGLMLSLLFIGTICAYCTAVAFRAWRAVQATGPQPADVRPTARVEPSSTVDLELASRPPQQHSQTQQPPVVVPGEIVMVGTTPYAETVAASGARADIPVARVVSDPAQQQARI